jgi:putative aldouronate transport system substrate-binding protein
MKRSIKILCLLTAIILVIALFSGCSKDEKVTPSAPVASKEPVQTPDSSSDDEQDEGDGTFKLPIVEEPLTLSMWFPLSGIQTTVISDYGEVTANKMLAERTGITIDYIHPASGQELTSYNLLITSGDYPDMIYHGSVTYNGGWDKAVEDGIYLKLNDYIEQYAPNYQAIRDISDEHRKMSITDSGTMYGFHEMMTEREPTWTGLGIRKDWLDDLNLEMPSTIDDWTKVLTAFKDEKGAEAPLMIPTNGKFLSSEFCSAWGIGTDFYQVNGEVRFGPVMDEYKEYLNLMRGWYSDRLLDKDFTTRTDMTGTGAPSNMTGTGKTGAFPAVWGACHDVSVQNNTTDDPNYWLEPIVAPTLQEGEKVQFRSMSYQVRAATSIFATTEHPVECIKWLDYRYTQEATDLMWWADETVHYIDENGDRRFTDMMLNDPNGLNFYQTTSLHLGKGCIGIHDWHVMRTVYPQELLDVCLVWDSQGYDYVLPPITLTADEGERVVNNLNDINTLVEEYTVKCITGADTLDRFDEFVAKIYEMGIEDILEVYQVALNRYNSR